MFCIFPKQKYAHFYNYPKKNPNKFAFFQKVMAYNINFLFVLASYITNSDNESVKQRIHDKFRTDLRNVYNSKYDFFHVTPLGDIKTFVENNFENYIGKMYRSENSLFIWFAFDKGTTSLDELKAALNGQAIVESARL